MNDQLAVVGLLTRTADTLEPDIERLVSSGVARGRARRRRRRVGTGLAAAAALTAGVVAVPHVVADHTAEEVGYADGGRRSLAVVPGEIAPTLASLLPGDSTPSRLSDGFTSTNGMISGDLLWRGAKITVGIDSSSEDPGDPDGVPGAVSVDQLPAGLSPEQWCEALAGDRCRPLGDGSWANSNDAHEPGNPGNWQTGFSLFTADGYLIVATANNGQGWLKDPAPEPVLTVDQLRDIAQSDVWFE